MKIELEGKPPLIVGKRVTIGAAVTSVTAMLAFIFPEYSPAIIASAGIVTFITQLIVANVWGVTSA